MKIREVLIYTSQLLWLAWKKQKGLMKWVPFATVVCLLVMLAPSQKENIISGTAAYPANSIYKLKLKK